MDELKAGSWRLSEANGFVVRDYTNVAHDEEPVVVVLKAEDLFRYLTDAIAQKREIAVYAIGAKLLDWS